MSTPDFLDDPERVAKGAALLDQRMPGWVDRIDLDDLDLSSRCNCVLGQLADDDPGPGSPFTRGTIRLFGDSVCSETPSGSNLEYAPSVIGHGFAIVDTPGLGDDELYDPAMIGDKYAALTAWWRRLIEARRAEVVDTDA